MTVQSTINIKLLLKKLVVLVGAIVAASSSYANPVLSGTPEGATVSQTKSTITVKQTSPQAILNWKSFNIGKKEKTHFIQKRSDIALNRIDPNQGASQIFGKLIGAGKIILINQAGIYFRSGSSVNVGSLIASTIDITDDNFRSRNYIFDQYSPDYVGSSVVNQGSIIAKRGLVALLGNNVENNGTIQADLGSVVLASGNKFTVAFSDDGLINFAVNEASSQGGKVVNSGSVYADGGSIHMTARAASGVVDNVINMSGVAQAKSVSQRNGVIILSGGEGKVSVSGKLDASGRDKGEKGGTVKVLGNEVELLSPSVIDVSGDVGAGEAFIGGNFRGEGPEQNALHTTLHKGSMILADAITWGDGGRVAVWSDEATLFYGDIRARGGKLGGDGGYVETSGHYLAALGSVYAGATRGNSGTWLLDPWNIEIRNKPSAHGAFNNNTPTNTYTPDGTSLPSSPAIADRNTIQNSLNNDTNVIIDAVSNPLGPDAGDITVVDSITKSQGMGQPLLTLNAAGSIFINNAISATKPQFGFDIDLNAGSSGVVTFGSAGSLMNRGNVDITAGKSVTLGSINTGAGDLAVMTFDGGNITQKASTSLVVGGAVNLINVLGSGLGSIKLGKINAGHIGVFSNEDISQLPGTALTIAGNSTFISGGSITLSNPTNNFSGVSLTSSGDASIRDINELNIGPTTIGQNFSITAGKLISQYYDISIGGALNITATTANTDIMLGDYFSFNNSFGAVTFGNPKNIRDVMLSNDNAAATLPTNLSSLSNLRNLSLAFANSNTGVNLPTLKLQKGGNLFVSVDGPITQSGSLTIAGESVFFSESHPITLSNPNNAFSGPVSLVNSGSNDVTLVNNRPLKLYVIDVGSGILSLTAKGSIIQTSGLGPFTDPILLKTGGNIKLSSTVANSDIFLNGIKNEFSGAITFENVTNIRDVSISNFSSSATLPTNITDLTNLRNLRLLFSNEISLPALTLHNGGSLSVAANKISQTGILTIPGDAVFFAVNDSIDLTLANNFKGSISLFTKFTHSSPIALTSTLPMLLGDIHIGTGALNLTAGGNIKQLPGVTLTQKSGGGDITLTSTVPNSYVDLGYFIEDDHNFNQNNFDGKIMFGNSDKIHEFYLVNDHANAAFPDVANLNSLSQLRIFYFNAPIDLPALTIIPGGRLSVFADGPITQSGALNVQGDASIYSESTIDLKENNQFTGSLYLYSYGGDITLHNVGPLNLSEASAYNGNVEIQTSGAVTLGNIDVDVGFGGPSGVGNFTLTANGDISQKMNASLFVSGNSSFSAGGNNITLANSGNDFSGTVSLNDTNNASIKDKNELTLSESIIGGNLLLAAKTGIFQADKIIVQGTTTITPTSNTKIFLALHDTDNDFNGDVILSGNSFQDIWFVNTNANANLPVNLTKLTGLRHLTIEFSNSGISLPKLTLRNGGMLGIYVNGDINQTGALTIPGGAVFNAGANSIHLPLANLISNAIGLSNTGNNDVVVNNNTHIVLMDPHVGSGNLSITAKGNVLFGNFQQESGPGPKTITITSSLPGAAIDINGEFSGDINIGNPSNVAELGIDNIDPTARLPINFSNLTKLRSLYLLFDNAGIDLPTIALQKGGELSIDVNGPITQSGILTTSGQAYFHARSNDITLPLDNMLTGLVSLNNSGTNNVQLVNNMPLKLNDSYMGAGTISLKAKGSITSSNDFWQETGAGGIALESTVPNSDIILSGNNHFEGAITFDGDTSNIRDVTLSNTSPSAVVPTNLSALSNLHNLSLLFYDNASTLSLPALELKNGGNLFVVSSNDNITQSGSLIVPGISLFYSNKDIILTDHGNTLTGFVTFGNSDITNTIDIYNSIALNIYNLNYINGTLNFTSADKITLKSIQGNLGTTLSLDSPIGTVFNGSILVDNLFTITRAGSIDKINTPTITTRVTQDYSNPLVLGMNTKLTTQAGNISIHDGITGVGKTITISGSGHAFSDIVIVGNLALKSIAINDANSLTVDVSHTTQTWNINGINKGNVVGLPGVGTFSFKNIPTLKGNDANDIFVFQNNTPSAIGSIQGSTGDNTIIGKNIATNWTIQDENQGVSSYISNGFADIQNLTGGTAIDTFDFMDGSKITGVINGGAVSSNILDFSDYSTPVDDQRSNDSGTVKNNLNEVIATYLQIQQVIEP